MKSRTISKYQILLVSLFALGANPCFSQIDTLVNNYHTIINVQPEAIISIEGHLVEYDSSDDVTAAEGRIRLNGSLQITGDIINKSHSPIFIDEGIPGNLIFAGDEDQRILDGIGNLGNDTTIYMPSLIMNKDGGALFVQQTVTIDSTIRFDPDNVANIHVLGTDTMIMQASGIIVGERNLSSRIYFEEGNISVEVPTFSNLEGLADTPDELSIENLFGLGWGYTNNLEQIKGEDGDDGDDISVSRHDTIAQSITQIANGNYLSRFYRLEFYESDRDASAPDLDTLTGVVFHFFDEDLNGLSTDNLSMYVSNDDGESWLQMDNGVFNSATLGTNDSTQTLLVENVPVRGTVNDSDAINWFVVAESECENPPNNSTAIASLYNIIDDEEETYAINACEGEPLSLFYSNGNDFVNEYSWWLADSLITLNDSINYLNLQEENEGVYTFKARNKSGCETSRAIQVNVWSPPSVDFDFTTGNICLGENASFTSITDDLEGEVVRWEWDFGDGSNDSELTNPEHLYESDMVFNVTLEVESEYGCINSISKNVIIHPVKESAFSIRPEKFFPEITEICAGESVFFDPSHSLFEDSAIPDLYWDFGDGNTDFFDNSLYGLPDTVTLGEVTHIYDVTEDRTFDVSLRVVTSADCETILTKQITVYARPNANFSIQSSGIDITEACTGEELQFVSDAALIDASAYNYIWDFDDGTESFDAFPSKIYTKAEAYLASLEITSKSTGCTSTDNYSIDIGDSPTLSFGENITVCGSSIELDATNNDVVSYEWTEVATGDTFTNATYEVNSATDEPIDIIIEVENIYGCIISQSTQVQLNTELSLDLGPDVEGCEEVTIGTNEFEGADYLWSTGETSAFITVTSSGTYSLTIDDDDCSSSTYDEIEVTVYDPPIVTLGDDRELCDGELLTLNAGTHTTYRWSNGTTNSSLDVSTGGIYWVEVTNEFGCAYRDSVFIDFKDDFILDGYGDEIECNPQCIDNVDASFYIDGGLDTNTVCEGLMVQFISEAALSDASAYDFFWDFGDETTSEEPMPYKSFSDSNTYLLVELTVTSKINGCGGLSQGNISVESSPKMPFSDVARSCGNSITLDALNTGANYLWLDRETNDILSTDQTHFLSSDNDVPIEITLEISNAAGCTVSQNIDVILNSELIVDLGEDRLVCQEEILGTLEYPTAEFDWSTGETTPTILATESGTYSVTITDPDFGCTTSDEVTIEVQPLPEANLGPDYELCLDETVILFAGEFESYLWSDGSTNQTLEAGTTGYYWVDVFDEFGCSDRDSVYVRVLNDDRLDLPSEIELCSVNGFTVDAGVKADSYEWGSSVGLTSNERAIFIDSIGTYWVTVTNELGCIQTDTIEILETSGQLEASFLVPSVVGLGDTVTFVQLTDPIPEFVQWAFGDGHFSQEINPTHQYFQIDDFTVTLMISNGYCSDTLQKVVSVVDPRFMEEEEFLRQELLEILTLKSYPNPTTDRVNLTIELTTESAVSTRIFNLSGREVYASSSILTQEEIPIDISEQLPGIYFMYVQVGDQYSQLIKIMKQ